MKSVLFNIFIAVFILVWIGASATACTTSPVANIISPDPNYVGVLGPWDSRVYGKVIVDGSGSSDADGTIVKYEWDYDWDGIAAHFHADYWETTSYHWDGNFDGRHCGACYAEPGQYTLGLRVTDNDNLTDTATCTIYAVQLELDVPTSYPQWVHVDDTLNLGCTVTPSGLGGSYSWSKEVGFGTLTFSPSASVEDPTVSNDTRGLYRAMVEYTVDWVTLLDKTSNIYVPEVQLFRNSDCDEGLEDWPAEGGNPRSPKYLFGKDDPIYVKVPFYDPYSDETGEYFSAVMVKSESDTSGDIKLNIKEPYDGARSCYNEVAAAEELLYLDSSSWQGAGDRIKVVDEEVLTFYLEVPPDSGIYVESNSVMVDRAEVGVEWQSDYATYDSFGSLGCADDFAEGFYDELGTANFVWWKQFNNGDLNSKESHWDSIGDTVYADNVDFAVWCGHGTPQSETPRALRFFVDLVGGNKQPPDKLTWSEVDWGDQDVEWVVLNTCRFLKGNDTELKEMASGVHLICGYETDMTIFCDAGEWFADALDTMTIKNAWWAQCDEFQPTGNTARVFGADYCVNDSIIKLSGGMIFVPGPDPTASDTYVHWDFTKQ